MAGGEPAGGGRPPGKGSKLASTTARLKAQRLRNEELREELQEIRREVREPIGWPKFASQLERLLVKIACQYWVLPYFIGNYIGPGRLSKNPYVDLHTYAFAYLPFYFVLHPVLVCIYVVVSAVYSAYNDQMSLQFYSYNIVFVMLFLPLILHSALNRFRVFKKLRDETSSAELIFRLAEAGVASEPLLLSQPSVLKHLFIWQPGRDLASRVNFIASHLEYFAQPARPYILPEIMQVEIGIIVAVIASAVVFVPLIPTDAAYILLVWGGWLILSGVYLHIIRQSTNALILLRDLKQHLEG